MPKPTTATPATPGPLSPGLRRYLYFTAAITGGAIMIVEILGAKMLAPFIGTSHFVWTAQIAVTLVALATGYYAGGKLVDRAPRLELLYAAIVAAALYLAGTMVIVEPLAYWCLKFKLAVGSLLASALLYFFPLALLAMVGPFFVRMLTSNVSGVGGNVGRLTAISTLGSFIGTLLIGYALIPFLRNSVTMYLVTGVLLAVAAGYFLGWGRRSTPITSLVLASLAVLGLGAFGVAMDRPAKNSHWKEIHRANSHFGNIQIFDDPETGYRYYLNDFLPQNGSDPRTGQSIFTFTYMLHALARSYHTNIQDVLAIGLGVGIVPMQFVREGERVEVVEINPTIVPVGKEYFGLEPERLKLTIGDGREYANHCTNKFDAIILDAFLGDSVPTHLMSRESFARLHKLLRPGGVLVINSFGGDIPAESFITASLEKTLQAVFRSVKLHSASGGNVFLVASDQSELRLQRRLESAAVHPRCRAQVMGAFDHEFTTNPDRGIVLTDDFNPVEYYDASNREVIRRELALSIRGR